MTKIQEVAKEFDITDEKSLAVALRKCKNVTDAEINYLIGFDLGGQTVEFKNAVALARTLSGLRAAREMRRQTIITAIAGLSGAIIGAAATVAAAKFFMH